MTKEKQIEEMAEMLEIIENAREIYANDVTDHSENEYIREGLLDAGYRKQGEGEWKAYPDEHEICATEFVCSNCKESFCTNEMTDWEFIETMKYCPNCGAKMKGA